MRAADLTIPTNLSSSVAPGQEECHRDDDNNIGALGMLNTEVDGSHMPEARATEPRIHASSPEVQLLSSHISGHETGSQGDEVKPLVRASRVDHTAITSREGVDGPEGDWSAPRIEGCHDEKELRTHTDPTGIFGLDTTPLVAAAREMARVGNEAGLPSGLVHPRTHPKGPCDVDTGAVQVGMQADLSIPMDEDEEESEPPFDVLSNTNTTLVPLYQPHSYSRSLNIEQDDLIVEDIDTEFVADSAMEDAGMESCKEEASVPAETLQPFSWIPLSVSSSFHALFPGVPSTQMTAFVNTAARVLETPVLSDPYAMGSTTSEGAGIQQVASPLGIPWPFVSDETHPFPWVEDESFNEPDVIVPRLSPNSTSNVSASQTTCRSAFPLTSLPVSRAGPIPVLPSTLRRIESHKEADVDLDEGMDPNPGVAANVQHEASSRRCV